ncbi:ethylene-responsive proteinase inhibitor 1 [Capsicum chacoense]|uniref:Ethylene-responsive proteinase inhibitor 1 n=1 Tax=Capsicum annuum TaxID=4072 RepID=A0A1U8G7N9_CAPAN|nr:ethylene-responsive proteinase inhibitor 1 [Capsicum annuum]KAF3659844.1 Ethylene-responsive proteinase inhibitor 1 [Capsicum annuum]PHT92444.1 Ethylene-responsive proteinase inhibitor 1 [Capsicum annuum]
MEAKMSMVKLVALLLILASCFQSLSARDLEMEVNDGLNVLELLDVSQSICPGVTKEKWPELLGTPAKFAQQIIQKENPKLTNVVTVLNGGPVTEDLRCNRVRLFVNLLDFVVQTPQVG